MILCSILTMVFEHVPEFIVAMMLTLVDCSIFASNIAPFLGFKQRQSHCHTSQEPKFEKLLAYQSFTRSMQPIALTGLGPMSSLRFDQN